jgi:large subunit ribosomal protein L1
LLADLSRYIRAFEVGRPPSIFKYECHVKLKTRRDGAVVRNQIKLPHTVKTGTKICAICPPGSDAAKAAREAGAVLVGEDEVFEIVKSGRIDFTRCIAHPDSLEKINKAGLPRILGPKGLMPNIKMGTIVENIGSAVRLMLGGSIYREKRGVVSMAVGQLGFTPEHLRDNMQTFLTKIKDDAYKIVDMTPKQIDEVVCTALILFVGGHSQQAGPEFNKLARIFSNRKLQKRKFAPDQGLIGMVSPFLDGCQPFMQSIQVACLFR